jgi:hypothetical protein
LEGVRVSTLTIVEVDSEDQVTEPSNDFYKKNATEQVQHSAYRASSLRRKGAASHIIDMVWLYCSTIPVGRKGGLKLFHVKAICLRCA